MKQFIVGFLIFGLGVSGFAQQPATHQDSNRRSKHFLKVFMPGRDSILINFVVSDGVILQTIGKNH